MGLLGVGVVGIHMVDRRGVDAPARLGAGGLLAAIGRPLRRRVDAPIHGVTHPVSAKERQQPHVVGLCEPRGDEGQRRASRLDGRQHVAVCRDEAGDLRGPQTRELRRLKPEPRRRRHVPATQVASQQNGSRKNRQRLRVAWQRHHVQGHRQAHRHDIAALPLAAHRQVRTGLALDRDWLAIDGQRRSGTSPRWIAHLEGQLARPIDSDGEPGRVFIGESRLLTQDDALLAPGED